MKPSPKDKEGKEEKAEGVHKAFKKAFWPTFGEQLIDNETMKKITFKDMPNKPTTLREFREKLNNAHITGHISGRHLILLGGEKDREWDGGGYEENEYRFLDEYIESLLTSHNTELVQKIEGMKKELILFDRKYIKAEEQDEKTKIYNQALDEVIKLINQDK